MGAMAIVVCMVNFKKENVGLEQANNYISNGHDVTMVSRAGVVLALHTPPSISAYHPAFLVLFVFSTHHRAQRKDHPEIP